MSAYSNLPFSIVEQIQEHEIPEDSVIFYRDNQWVYTTRDLNELDNRRLIHPIDSLGPFDVHSVHISLILLPEQDKYRITQIGNRTLNEDEQLSGVFAPIAQITLEGFARSVANIPENATDFCWLYPPRNTNQNNEINLDDPFERNLLKLGGFAYFFADKICNKLQLLRVNSFQVSERNGLTFEGPHIWKQEFTEQLWNQRRFQPVTLPILREKGAKYFAFIYPYESFSNEHNPLAWTPTENGAFVYLFNDDHSPNVYDCYFSVSDNCLGVAPSDEQ